MNGLLGNPNDPYGGLLDPNPFAEQIRRGWGTTKQNAPYAFANAGDAIRDSIMSVAQPDMGFTGDEQDYPAYQQQQRDKAGTSFQMALGAMPLARFPQAMRAPAEAPLELSAPERITAYHGSPYDFDKFDVSKLGTGEGSQAGWGTNPSVKMYGGAGFHFAEHEPVAQRYRDVLTKELGVPGKGHMYEVGIPKEGMIDLNGPISNLPDDLQQLASKHGYSGKGETYFFLRSLQRKMGEIPARDKLQSMGVKGTIHDDPLQHAQQFKGKNYSVFDPEDIEILRKYGLVGGIGAGAYASQYNGGQQ